jgi:hypothetical protein
VSALQLYGIIAAEAAPSSPAENTTLIPFRGIAAVVAPVPYARQELDDGALDAYADVVEKIYDQMPILPAPPGTVFRSATVLARWLELHYVGLTDALAALEPNTTARVTIRLREGPITDETLKEWQGIASESLRMLRGQAAAMTTNPDRDGDDPTVLARSSFLLDRERWQSFQASVRAESRRHPHLDFTVTGPWPPYDFVRMQFGS